MFLSRRKDLDALRADEGIGMLLVIGISTVVFTLVAAGMMIASTALRESTNRTDFEMALAAAEEGVDIALARQQDAFNGGDTAGVPIPSDAPGVAIKQSNCTATEIPKSTFDGMTAEEELQSAEGIIDNLANATATNNCLQEGESGEFLVMRPSGSTNSGSIYAKGWSPAYEDGATERFLKVDYIFVPYNPQHAILTGGDLYISGSVDVDVIPGAEPVAGIHTNSDLELGAGSITVCGQVSATGSIKGKDTYDSPDDCSGPTNPIQSPVEDLPEVDALGLYKRAPTMPTAADAIAQNLWFDLCPGIVSGDFEIRSYSSSGIPCTGTVMGNQDSAVNFGVNYSSSDLAGGPTFSTTNAARDGVFYAHQANLTTKQGGKKPSVPPRRTLIASAASTCDVATGNIYYTHQDMEDGPFIRNLFMMAETDLLVGPNLDLGDVTVPIGGMFVAGDELDLRTSSDQAVGAAVAIDKCEGSSGEMIDDGGSRLQGISFFFDPNAESPFSSLINITLWQEV